MAALASECEDHACAEHVHADPTRRRQSETRGRSQPGYSWVPQIYKTAISVHCFRKPPNLALGFYSKSRIHIDLAGHAESMRNPGSRAFGCGFSGTQYVSVICLGLPTSLVCCPDPPQEILEAPVRAQRVEPCIGPQNEHPVGAFAIGLFQAA